MTDGRAAFLRNATGIYSMNKTLALSPKSITRYQDWLKFFDKLGQPSGLFFANFPKAWLKKFDEHLESMDLSDWDDWDKKKIFEYFAHLKSKETLTSLRHQYNSELDWETNFSELPLDKKNNCIAIGEKNNKHGFKDFKDLNPTDLKVTSYYKGALPPKQLANLLSTYFNQTKKIAFVDRHNYLLNSHNSPTQFAQFIQEVLETTCENRLGEIIIYTRFNYDAHPYMKTESTIKDALAKCFRDHTLPIYGIKYVCCEEVSDRRVGNLHTRLICTNHVVFHLGDSIPGKNDSQQYTRITDNYESSGDLTRWIDEDHGLKIISEATYTGP